jgi:hypothetical protein
MSDNKAMNDVDALPPLDDFERAWTSKLSEPDAELSRSSEAFVQGVLDRHDAEVNRPAIAGRIGSAPLPFAAAAAVLIAALVGWFVMTGNNAVTDGSPQVADNDESALPGNAAGTDRDKAPDALQPDAGPRVTPVDPKKIQLGRMIAQTQSTVTKPASNLSQTVSEAPQALSMQKLLDLINSPIPNLKETLEPLKPNDDQQSRA